MSHSALARASVTEPIILKINKLGASRKHQLSVAAFANGTTIGCKLRLVLTLS